MMRNMLLMMLATSIWGLGFVGTRWTLESYSPTWSNGLRFILAALLALPFLWGPRRHPFNRESFVCGALLGVGLHLQTVGIGLTSLAKSGFLTAFYALFTPLLLALFFGKRFRATYWPLLALALLGIFLLCEMSFSAFNRGDVFILVSAFFFSWHIIAIDHWGVRFSPILFNFQQIFWIALLALIFGTFQEGPPDLTPLTQWGPEWRGFIVLAPLSSMLAFSIQCYVQKFTPPHIVSLIYLLESVFATGFGYLFFREALSPLALVGCGLVLLAVGLIPWGTRYQKQ